jgi:hypothetical protein
MVMRFLVARTHHEIIELRGAGHELWSTHSHTDLHKSRVLAGLCLPHLTHNPAGGEERYHGSQDSSHDPGLPISPTQVFCYAGVLGYGGVEGSEVTQLLLCRGSSLVLRK